MIATVIRKSILIIKNINSDKKNINTKIKDKCVTSCATVNACGKK